MIRLIKSGLPAIFLFTGSLLFINKTFSQLAGRPNSILFYQLNTAHGLSDNYIWDMCVDKTGNLWIGSGDGLNMFNGKSVTKYFREEYPQLHNDYIRKLFCDDLNRIWVLCQGGNITMIDENRKFHKINLSLRDEIMTPRWLLYSKDLGAVLFTKSGLYSLSGNKNILKRDSLGIDFFSPVMIQGMDTLLTRGFSQIEPFDEFNYILSIPDGFFKINFKERRVEGKYLFPNLYILGKWLPGELLVYDKKNLELQSINLRTQKTSWPLRQVKDQYGKPLTARIYNARMINDETLLITTQREGMYLFNLKTKMLVNYRHDSADPTSLVNNWPILITTGNNGWVFIGTRPNGISYFKSNAVIGQQSVFKDRQGNSYDGHIGSIITRDNNTFYLAASDNLLKWKRNTNTTTFVDYAESNGKKLMNSESPGNMEFDRLDRLWLRTNEHGVFVLNKNDRAIKNLVYDTSRANTLPSGWVTDIKQGPGNYMWLATDRGICKVNIHSFDIDNLSNSPLSKLKGISCYYLFFSDSNNLWIATIGKGLWHYSFTTDSIRIFNKEKGFISDNVFCINKDNDGNIYVGTEDGLQILLRNGNMKRITRKDGLMNSRVEALLLDKRNRMWIGNDVGIACFSIKDSTLRYFDETYGLSIQGFRLASYCHTSDDELLWGTEKGMQYFYPDELYNYKTDLKININRLESRKIVANLTQSDTFHLASNDNYVTFSFSTIEYLTQLRTFYEYKLENLDADWIKVTNQNSVRYSSIPPGSYTFKVRASNDGKTWKEAGNIITIIVAKTIWQQLWFRILGALLGILLIIFVIRFYKKKQAVQREELETQVVINYFASQINLHRKTEDILWDVAKNCISKLNFEDCVIYLLDENTNVLIQKAAYGPKVAKDFTIHQPIEIPVGKGIVGSVAQTGKAELISNTEQDARYIADDVRRYSELAVPLIIDNRVIGVIDSEHSRKNFFTKRHLNILATVAVLCANQIQRSRAEEEKQHAKIEALETKQKVTESRLQSLRLQMNPHFLFNALNSIQQMILGNEEMVATRYLSRFSKLLRTILIHSDKEMVTLKEELEILNLYVELEAIRFKESFRYSIQCDEDIDQDETKIPTLLVQPFVENAIWHGLMHKEGERRLLIRFFEKDDYLHCIIEDNGIGRAMSAKSKLAGGQNVMHTSKGISVSMERLRALANGQGSEKLLNIIDLSDDSGNACGTRVEISVPILN